jgi:hypothetical protein
VEGAVRWYAACGAEERLQLRAFEDVQDTATPAMHMAADDWLDQWLLYGALVIIIRV